MAAVGESTGSDVGFGMVREATFVGMLIGIPTHGGGAGEQSESAAAGGRAIGYREEP